MRIEQCDHNMSKAGASASTETGRAGFISLLVNRGLSLNAKHCPYEAIGLRVNTTWFLSIVVVLQIARKIFIMLTLKT